MLSYHIMYFLDYGQLFGGAVNTSLQQAVLMKRAGQKITVVVSDYLKVTLQEGYSGICAAEGLDLLQLTYPISSQPEDIDIVSVIENYDAVKAVIEKLQPDILHSVQINPIVELVSREMRIPHVMNIYQLKQDFFKIKYMDIFPHYHICDSQYFALKWRQYLNTESVCIRTVVKNADSMERRNFTGRNSLIYLCAGVICQRKNQLAVIKAFHSALQKNVKGQLFIYGYGSGEYTDQCKEYVRDNGLEDRIQFKGFCDTMEAVYSNADVLICGSTVESYPNVISEAMYNGLAIISTPVAGVPEIIRDHENGYLCNGYTEEDILEKILELEEDREKGEVERIIQGAYDTFERYHSANHITSQLIEYYNALHDNYFVYSKNRIEDVENTFMKIIAECQAKSHLFSNVKAVEKKLWYLYYIREYISNAVAGGNRKVYIWGTGNYGIVVKEIFEAFWDTLQLEGFLDTNKSGKFLGYRIYSPHEILDMQDSLILIAAVNGQQDMIQLLEEKSKRYCEDYFILSPRSW